MGGWEATERISVFSLTRLFPEEYPAWWHSPVSLTFRLTQEDCSRSWVQGWSMFHSQTSSQRFKFSKTSFYKATDCSVLRDEATHFSCFLQLWLTVRCGQGFKIKTKKQKKSTFLGVPNCLWRLAKGASPHHIWCAFRCSWYKSQCTLKQSWGALCWALLKEGR